MVTYHVSYGVKEINLKMFIVKGECRVVKGCMCTYLFLVVNICFENVFQGPFVPRLLSLVGCNDVVVNGKSRVFSSATVSSDCVQFGPRL